MYKELLLRHQLFTKFPELILQAEFKTKTQILLNTNKEMVNFGSEAKRTYIGLMGDESNTYKLFERFKMALYGMYHFLT